MNEIQRSISSIIKGYTIYLATQIATIIIALIMVSALITSGIISGITQEGFDPTAFNIWSMFSGMMTYMLIMLAAAGVMIYGMFQVYYGLKKLAPQLDEVGKNAVNQLSLAMLISIISSCVSFIPLVGGIFAICGFIVSLIFNVMGYSALRNSLSLTDNGKLASKKLFQAIVFYLIMIGCCITIIGILAVPVFIILYWIYLLQGWMNLRDSFATCDREIDNQ